MYRARQDKVGGGRIAGHRHVGRRRAMRSSALTSTSCGCGSSGSRRNRPESCRALGHRGRPTCWSPPSGPLRNRSHLEADSSLSARPWCRWRRAAGAGCEGVHDVVAGLAAGSEAAIGLASCRAAMSAHPLVAALAHGPGLAVGVTWRTRCGGVLQVAGGFSPALVVEPLHRPCRAFAGLDVHPREQPATGHEEAIIPSTAERDEPVSAPLSVKTSGPRMVANRSTTA